MTNLDQIDSIRIFIESAKELESSSFMAQAKQGVSTSMKLIGDKAILLERTGPAHEAVKALLLTVRFFCQDNETSIRKTEELINGLAISETLKAEFSGLRTKFNRFLDDAPRIRFQTSVGADTNRAIFDTFLYGVFAHANRDRRRQVKAWEQQIYVDDLRAMFDVILIAFVKVVVDMKDVCERVLSELGEQP